MRSSAFLGVAVLLLLVQSNLYRLLGPLGTLVGERFVHGATPSLLLPLVVFLGVYEPSMPRGAFLAFAMGYAQDVMATAPIGLFAFVHVAIWWLSRVAGVRLTAQTWWTRASLGFIFALVESAIVLIVLAVFGPDNRRPIGVASMVLGNAVATGLSAPALFQLAQRLRQGVASRPHADGNA